MAKRLLVVDDDPGMAASLADYLRSNGYEVATAGSVNDAEGLLERGVDLVILDCAIGNFSGEKFLDRLKAEPKTRGVPVIVCSGTADIRALERMVQRGAAGYFRKPFKSSELLTKVQTVLR